MPEIILKLPLLGPEGWSFSALLGKFLIQPGDKNLAFLVL
jgi:hypothetical protein